jgi:hypothetical protein
MGNKFVSDNFGLNYEVFWCEKQWET